MVGFINLTLGYNWGMSANILDSDLERDEDVVTPQVSALAAFILGIYRENQDLRMQNHVDDELLKCRYEANGQYTPDEIAKREAAGMPTSVYAPISDMKRRAATAWAGEIFLNTAEKTFEIHPTPLPDMPDVLVKAIAAATVQSFVSVYGGATPEGADFQAIASMASWLREKIENDIMEKAEERAARLDRVVHDIMTEGHWREEMTAAIDYLATYGTAVVKICKVRRNRVVRKVSEVDTSSFEVEPDTRLEFRAIDPMDCYPSRGAKTAQDGYFCQRVYFQPYELNLMIGEKGYMDDALREIIDLYSDTGRRNFDYTDAERDELDKNGPYTDKISTIEGVEFWGRVLGQNLIDNGILKDCNDKGIDGEKFYEVDCIVVSDKVIYCEMADPRLGRPLFKGTFYKVQGSWWGDSPMKKMRSVQTIANSALTSMAWNMPMSAGPQVAITDIERLPNPYDFTIRPLKVWAFRKPRIGNASDIPIKFFQAASNSGEMIAVYNQMSKEADNLTGIPAYAYGSDQAAGAGRTASGLSMLMDAAQRGMKHVIFSLSEDLLKPCVSYIAYHEMIESDDEGIKGDVTIDSGGILSVLTKDKTMNQIKEVIAMCQNPLFADVLGKDGMAYLARRVVSLIPHLNPDKAVKTKEMREFEEIKARLEQLQMQRMQMALAAQYQQQPGAMRAAGGGAPLGGSAAAPQPQQGIPLQDGIANVAAMGGQTPGSTVNQYQPNHMPIGDAEVMG